MPDFGGRVIPSVSINVGRGAKEDLSDLRRGVDELRRAMADLKRQADDAARSVAAATSAASSAGGRRRGGGGSSSTAAADAAAANTARAAKEAERQQKQAQQAETRRQRDATRAAQNTPKVFAGMSSAGLKTDKEFLQYNKAIHERYEDALKQNEELTAADRKTLSNSRNVAGAITARKGEGALSKGVNAVSWAPIPGGQNLYMMQMAMESMALNPAIMAGVLGAMLVGGAALGLNEMLVSNNRTGEQLSARVGTTPTFLTGSGAAGQLQALQNQYHLKDGQSLDIAGGLAAGGLDSSKAMGTAFGQAAVLVNVFGMSVQDSTALVSKSMVDLGYTSDQFNQLLQNLAQTAGATGTPISSLGAILTGAPNLQANVTNPQEVGPALNAYKAVYGSNSQASTIAGFANTYGADANMVAGVLGMPLSQLQTLQGTKQGQGQLIDMIDARARQFAQQSGPENGFTIFNALLQQAGGSPIDEATWKRVLGAGANAGATAAAITPVVPLGPPVPGSAQAAINALASGNNAVAAAAAQPWNVASMTVNAAKLQIDFAGNQAQAIAAAVNPASPASALTTIAAGGGPAAQVANVVLAKQGDGGAAATAGTNALEWLASTFMGASPKDQARFAGGAEGAASAVEHALHLTVDITQNGKTVGTKQITTSLPNSGQTYNQYVPTRAKPGN